MTESFLANPYFYGTPLDINPPRPPSPQFQSNAHLFSPRPPYQFLPHNQHTNNNSSTLNNHTNHRTNYTQTTQGTSNNINYYPINNNSSNSLLSAPPLTSFVSLPPPPLISIGGGESKTPSTTPETDTTSTHISLTHNDTQACIKRIGYWKRERLNGMLKADIQSNFFKLIDQFYDSYSFVIQHHTFTILEKRGNTILSYQAMVYCCDYFHDSLLSPQVTATLPFYAQWHLSIQPISVGLTVRIDLQDIDFNSIQAGEQSTWLNQIDFSGPLLKHLTIKWGLSFQTKSGQTYGMITNQDDQNHCWIKMLKCVNTAVQSDIWTITKNWIKIQLQQDIVYKWKELQYQVDNNPKYVNMMSRITLCLWSLGVTYEGDLPKFKSFELFFFFIFGGYHLEKNVWMNPDVLLSARRLYDLLVNDNVSTELSKACKGQNWTIKELSLCCPHLLKSDSYGRLQRVITQLELSNLLRSDNSHKLHKKNKDKLIDGKENPGKIRLWLLKQVEPWFKLLNEVVRELFLG